MKKLLFTICALLAVGSTFAENTFSINTVYASTSGISTIEVNYSLDAGFACGGFSFDLQLPDEFEFVGKNAYTPGDCYASTPTFTTNLTADGVLKVAYATSAPLTKQSGTLASFQIRAKSTAVAGTTPYDGLLTAAKFVDNSTSASENAADVPFNIVATNGIVLDEESTILPVAQSGVDVLVKRSIKKDVWNTICLPFAMTEAQLKSAFGDDVELAYLNTENAYSVNENAITINFNLWEVSWGLLANYPLLIKTSATIEDFTVDNVDVVADESAAETSVQWVKSEKSSTPPFPTIQVLYAKYIGTLKAGTSIPADNLFLSGNRFYYSTGTTTIKGFRGYFYFKDFNSSAFAPEFVINGETTNIEGLQIVDGDGRIYNLNGQHVENPTKKGVYIQNGKKIVIK